MHNFNNLRTYVREENFTQHFTIFLNSCMMVLIRLLRVFIFFSRNISAYFNYADLKNATCFWRSHLILEL